jgi:hypothetical protein
VIETHRRTINSRSDKVQSAGMKSVGIVAGCGLLSFAFGCGGSGMASGGDTTTNPPPPSATITISNTTIEPFSVAMSTSFQPAEWDYQFFTTNPTATTTLGNLNPHHIRLQGVSQGIPQGLEGTSSTAWDFSTLDAIAQPVLSMGDHSPEFQIAKAPAFMYANNDSSGSFLDPTYAAFSTYAQGLVEYYNTGGFTANSNLYVSPAYTQGDKITWWGIYNEPNINNNLTALDYAAMYNRVVPAMQSVDPTIKFAALELADFSGQVAAWVPTFVSNVTARVDVMATHFYSTCNQQDRDDVVFRSIPGFAADVQAINASMVTNQALAGVPVWVTENNINADYDAGGGISACNGTTFVPDLRGSSPFFAAWRPYVFSQLGKNGVQALYHWDFDADQQFGEVDYNTDALQLSYWVDYWLGQEFPPNAGSQLLQFTSTDDFDFETLPVVNSDGSVVVMIANHALNSVTDNNGPGVTKTIAVDVSALGTFSSVNWLTIDKNTSVQSGPVAAAIQPEGTIPVTLNGYSVGFLSLKP